MQCAAVARRSGRRCGQRAIPGGQYCRYHRADAETRGGGAREAVGRGGGEKAPEGSFYGGVLEEGPGEMELAAALRGVEDEIALLRTQIRKAAREGDVEATRRGIETLCRALKVQYAMEGRSAEGLAGSLARVLEEVGNELGMTL